jgi:hypothetical protein
MTWPKISRALSVPEAKDLGLKNNPGFSRLLHLVKALKAISQT